MSLIACSVSDLRDCPGATRWAIVRHAMARQPQWRRDGVVWMPQLAPSAALLAWWRDSILAAPHDPAALDRLWREYAGRFVAEKATDGRYMAAVKRGARLAAAGHLAIACWCAGGEHCHRRLVEAAIRLQLATA